MRHEEYLVFGVQAVDQRFDIKQLALDNLNMLLPRLALHYDAIRIAGVLVGEKTDAQYGIPGALLLCCIEQVINFSVLLRAVVWHVSECARILGCLPTYIVETDDAETDRHFLVIRCCTIFDSLIQNSYILLEGVLLLVHVGQDTREPALIGFYFVAEAHFGLVDKVTVVLPLNTALKAEGNEQADGDGGEVDKKVAPTVNRLVGRMNINHGSNLIEIHCCTG
jgi:hypothetical protein